MNRSLINELVCPYCGGGFTVQRAVRSTAEHITYGLIECRCFVFPIIDGVLLLSLAKGYGGAEEALQPYVPLLAAAVKYLEQDDVAGLRAWIERHVPLASLIMDDPALTYVQCAQQLAEALDRAVCEQLAGMARYEHLGVEYPPIQKRTRWRRSPPSDTEVDLTGYYISRFFSPRVASLALQLAVLPTSGRLLSLCCGQGVFENLVASSDGSRIVSVDAQFLNLLITRRFCNPTGSFICHDVQFPLPFKDGAFDGVFSSTCLPEIPTQRSFIQEALRATSKTGWTSFDSMWNTEIGVERIDRKRHYRFCQNFFARLEDYVLLIETCAGSRLVGIDIPSPPRKYLDGATWAFEDDRAPTLAARQDPELSALVVDKSLFRGFVTPEWPPIEVNRLCISPVFVTSPAVDGVVLSRRSEFADPPANFVPAGFPGFPERVPLNRSRTRDIDWLLDRYCDGVVALLPQDFWSSTDSMSGLRDR